MPPTKETITGVPKFGLKLKLNHVYPEKWSQNRIPPLHQLYQIITLIIRYVFYHFKCWWEGRRAIMDYINVQNAKQIYGVPMGGIGCGSIGRGYKGEFCRYQLRPGLYDYGTLDANQFIVTIKDKHQTIFQSLLSTYKRQSKCVSSWKSLITDSKCNYTGLYPRGWTEYDLSEYGIKLTCRQVSPVIPNNYKDSSMPCAVFIWNVENVSTQELNVTISFTFQNGIGVSKVDSKSTCSSKPFTYQNSEGVILYHTIDKTPSSYSLAVKTNPDVSVSKCLNFDPKSDGKTLWDQLNDNGKLIKQPKKSDNHFGELGVAIAAQCTVPPKSNKEIEYVLVWDIPVVTFFYKKKKYTKYYTKFFGMDAALKMVDYALMNYATWEEEIYKWQEPVLSDNKLPAWYKSALFNETYFVSDGGSMWFVLDEDEAKKLPPNDPRKEFGRFGYLEGHEYRMVNTYDVHFYASYALALNWPKIQALIQYDFKDAIFVEEKQLVKELFTGHYIERKVINSVPHDLGDPGEEPYELINAYPIHDVSQWRDLNTKFVLQVFRDFSLNQDLDKKQYLEDMYEALTKVMKKSEAFDTDNDGLIENSGIPDQTFDTWVMRGPSAYCGGLWLAALHAMTIICDFLDKQEDKAHYAEILNRGIRSFDRKLWNGKCYNFDTHIRREGDIYMADQLCGHWYLKSSGCNYEVFPEDKVKSSLRTVFENNVMKFQDGTMGAVNGFTASGSKDVITLQSEEVWIGVTYALAATMLQEGLEEEAWQTAGGLYKTMSQRLGLSYETPEALYEKHYYRSIGYMRPLSIWSMQRALQVHEQSKQGNK
ncbi:LOW QUALITY PROTEIN: non-lysosomal glucosylceramidase [Atheta coriaria]|uniref:LOW QUALITY PROTEIN: non-lysosomal glucosylceramidase n=1 Tax=Dalotia coriaria TaxID=877792 RepID=UPI0031F397F7